MTKPGHRTAKTDKELDRGLMYAEACFETFRVIDGQVFAWEAHMMRLQRGLAEFGIPLPEGLKARCLEAATRAGRDTLLRLTVTGGVATWGLAPPGVRQPGVYVLAIPYQSREASVALHTVTWPFPLRPKMAKFTADYAEILRVMRMHDCHVKAEGGLLVCDGHRLHTGLTANVLVYRKGRWWTPGPETILPGVIRSYLVQAGVVCEVECPLAWLQDCTAMALTNSGAFIQPVASIDGRSLVSREHPAFALLWRHLAGQPGVPETGPCA